MCIYYIETCLEGHEFSLIYTKPCNYANSCRPLRYCDIEEVRIENRRKSKKAKEDCELCEVEKQKKAEEDAAAAMSDEEDEVEEEEPMVMMKKEGVPEQVNKEEETDELDECAATQRKRSRAPVAARRGRSTGRGLTAPVSANSTPAKRGRGQIENFQGDTPTLKKQKIKQER